MSEITRYHDLSEPRKRASANQLGKAFARSSDYLYENISKTLSDETSNPPEEIYVNRLVLLGVNVFGASLLEHLPRDVIGRNPRPDIALQDFWDELAALKQAFYDAFDKEVEARIAQRYPDDAQRKALEQLAAYDDLMRPLDVEYIPPPNLPEETPMPKEPKPKHPKIHQVAKDLGISSKELIAILREIDRDDLNHHMKTIDDPAIVGILPDIIASKNRQHLTVKSLAKQLDLTTDDLIAILQEIDHHDLNHPDAVIYDPEIVDHVREVLAENAQVAA